MNSVRSGLLLVLSILAVCFAPKSCLAANAGENESVKSWPARDMDVALKSDLPLFVYFFDKSVTDKNNMVKALEVTILGNADLKVLLKRFLVLKVRHDGTDVRGWPQNWRGNAENSAALLLTTSDHERTLFFDKNSAGKGQSITLDTIMVAAEQILAYEDSKKKVDKPKAKDTPPPTPVADAKAVPGLNLDKKGDDMKVADKKGTDKTPDKKKKPADMDE